MCDGAVHSQSGETGGGAGPVGPEPECKLDLETQAWCDFQRPEERAARARCKHSVIDSHCRRSFLLECSHLRCDCSSLASYDLGRPFEAPPGPQQSSALSL